MSLGSSANDVGYLLVGGISLIFIIPLLLGISSLIVRLTNRILGISSGWPIFMVMVLLGGVAAISASLYLDTVGVKTTGTVTEKTERVLLREQGDWRERYEMVLEYPYEGEMGRVTLNLGSERFDRLGQGDTAELELLPLYRTISFVRLAEINTADWLFPVVQWVGIGLLVVLTVLLLIRTRSTVAYGIIAVVGVAVAILIPLARMYRATETADDIASRPLRAMAEVTAIDHITHIDYFPCESNCDSDTDTSFDVPQRYDIVQMRYQPEGNREPLLVVDSADVGTTNLELGGTAEIAYAAEKPRDVQIVGATHTHHWRNATYYVWRYVVIWLVFIVAWFFVSRWFQNMGWLRRPVVDEY